MQSVAFGYFLNDQLAEVTEWGRRLISATENYFFGEWRRSIPGRDAAYWTSGGGGWIPEYRAAVALASALKDVDAIRRLSAHPSEDKGDASSLATDKPWYLLLAEYLARGKTEIYAKRLAAILDHGSKGQKILGSLLDAVVTGRRDEAAERFEEHMNFYNRFQKHRDEIDFKLAVDATILAHLAERCGIPIEFDEKWRDYLIYF